jgi:hypothetical protein
MATSSADHIYGLADLCEIWSSTFGGYEASSTCIVFAHAGLYIIEEGGKGYFVSREWSIFVRVKCEMLDFNVVKCDLFYSREA